MNVIKRREPRTAATLAEARRELWSLGREALVVGTAVVAYFGIRNLTAGSWSAASANADRILDLERWIGIAWERGFQSTIVGNHWVTTFANWVYIWGHWPVLLIAATVLYVYRRDSYYLLRNAMFISGALGFLFFALLPVAPPRLNGLGLVDTVTEDSHAYRVLQPPGFTNQYAAFPSLHFGWNLLLGIVLLTATAHVAVRIFAVLSPLAMAFAVVATANHFVLDLAGGAVFVLVGLAGASLLGAARGRATLDLGASRAPDLRPPHAVVSRRSPRRERHLAHGGRGTRRSRARRS
jgi:PAP2 superfamily